jgi:hypothetical protein
VVICTAGITGRLGWALSCRRDFRSLYIGKYLGQGDTGQAISVFDTLAVTKPGLQEQISKAVDDGGARGFSSLTLKRSVSVGGSLKSS